MATPTRKRLPRAQREQRMLDAAETVFGHASFTAASMEEIAELSGITKALLYQYFGSKEGLYEATVERGRALLFDDLSAAVGAAPPGRARLIAFVEGFFEYVEENRSSWWLLYGEAASSAVNVMRERNAELIAQLLGEAAEQAGRRVEDGDLMVLAHVLVGSGEQVGRWWVDHPEVAKEDVVRRFLVNAGGAVDATFRAGVRASG